MALIKRKHSSSPPPRPNKLARIANDDLYAMAEAHVMNAGYRLAQYRTASEEDKPVMLAWVDDEIRAVSTYVRELESRL